MSATATSPTPQPRPTPGPWDAVTANPELAPGSVRRVTAVDLTRPSGFDGPLVVQIRGRDVRRGADDDAFDEVLDELQVTLEIEEWTGELLRVEGTAHPGVGALVGASARRGYSRAVATALADDLRSRTLLGSAFEDLGGALLVSGYAPLRRGRLVMAPGTGAQVAAGQQDVCAGWAVGRPLVEVLRTEDVNACPIGPIGPEADTLVPTVSGLAVAPPGADAVTRIRTLDVGAAVDGTSAVRAHFRDSYASDEGPMVMHEYVVHARVGGTEPTIQGVEVEPRVLPWSDCPGAVASAQRIVGMPVAAIAGRARAELSGNETCTHLTSTLRSLTDVAHLLSRRPS
jgi:hypothetical protein